MVNIYIGKAVKITSILKKRCAVDFKKIYPFVQLFAKWYRKIYMP